MCRVRFHWDVTALVNSDKSQMGNQSFYSDLMVVIHWSWSTFSLLLLVRVNVLLSPYGLFNVMV